MDGRINRVGRIVIVAIGALLAAVVSWWVFVRLPGTLVDLLGVLVAIATTLIGARLAGRIADAVAPSYNVAEVIVEEPITRDGSSVLPSMPGGVRADDVVEQIERADDDRAARALLVKLNTPGGEVVPSDDIRRAAAAFDGPTIAYVTDTCASGGYWIASGCDELWARDASIVGSIGVIGSLVNASELADRVGLSYERFAAGEYKDAGMALKEITDDEREYLQGLVDDYYNRFIDRVANGRGLDPDTVRDTEARVYLGEEALERGLVDAVGDRKAVEEHVEGQLGESVSVRTFESQRGLTERLRRGTQAIAYGFGAGIASVVTDQDTGFELRS